MKFLRSLMVGGLMFASGCGIVEFALTDLNGWDLSACAGGGFDVCWELFTDNEDNIFGQNNPLN